MVRRKYPGDDDERPRNTGNAAGSAATGRRYWRSGSAACSLSGTYGTSDDTVAAIPFLERAIELGVDFLDSSDAYGLGQNEEVLGRALGVLRLARDGGDNIVVATKFRPGPPLGRRH